MHPLSPLGCRGQAPQPRSGASKTPGLRPAISGRNHSFCRRLPERSDTVRQIKCRLPRQHQHRPVHKRQIVSWEVADQHWRKIRSVAPLCPACCAAFAAGHHGCSLTCQAPICLACSRHTAANGIAWTVEIDHSLSHHAVQRFLPDQAGLCPLPAILWGGVTLQLALQPRHHPSDGRPRCASSPPRRSAPSCLPAQRSPA